MERISTQVTLICLTFLTLMTLTYANSVTFSIGDVSAELQSWGTVSFERGNDTVDLEYSRFTTRVSEVSVLDSSQAVLASHPFKMEKQEYQIDKWEGTNFMDLKAGARRLFSGPIGALSGFVDVFVYLFTQGGPVDFIKEDYDQNVQVDDALIVVKLDNITKCSVCDKAAFVDLRIEFTTKSKMGMRAITQEKSGVEILHIPASSGIFLGNKAVIDGERTEVVKGFPEIEQGADKTDVIIRIPTFSSAASYGLFVRQDRRTLEEAKKQNGTLGAILDSSAGNNRIDFKSFVTWLFCVASFLYVRPA